MAGFFAGASPLAANLRASCAVAQSEYGTARTSYLKAIDAVTAMKHVAAGSATAGGLAGESAGLGLPGKSTMPYAIELCRAETGLAGLDLQAGDSAAARKRLETALRRLQQAGSVVLARQVERMCAAISD
jgi:Tfp pilus assembly protein PilF